MRNVEEGVVVGKRGHCRTQTQSPAARESPRVAPAFSKPRFPHDVRGAFHVIASSTSAQHQSSHSRWTNIQSLYTFHICALTFACPCPITASNLPLRNVSRH